MNINKRKIAEEVFTGKGDMINQQHDIARESCGSSCGDAHTTYSQAKRWNDVKDTILPAIKND